MLITTLLASLSLAPAPADTLTVPEATATPPLSFYAPFQTDSLNMAGKAYDIKRILTDNAALATDENAFTLSLKQGESLPADTAEKKTSLVAFRFAVNADRFAKGKLIVPDYGDYRIYVDGKLTNSKELTFTPGRSYISLLCMTAPGKKQKFDVKLAGKELKGITFGEREKEMYTMGKMLWGDHCRGAQLSPSGKYAIITYYHTQNDGTSLWRMDISDTRTGKVLRHIDGYNDLKWWPKKDIVYYTRKSVKGTELCTYNPADNTTETVAYGLPVTGFTLAPTGDYIIYTQGQESRPEYTHGLKRLEDPDDQMGGWRNRSACFRFDLKTKQVQQLTFGSSSTYLSDISPDGKRLLVSAHYDNIRKLPSNRVDVYEIDAYTGKVDTLFRDTASISGGIYSPDGKQFLFKACPLAFNGLGLEVKEGQTPNLYDYRLYLYDRATRKVSPVLKNFAPSVERTFWLYGDNQIYFTATEGCDQTLFKLNPKTLKTTRYEMPVSYITNVSIAAGMKTPLVSVTGQTGERARELFLATLDKEKPAARRFGDIDFDKMFAHVAIGKCQDWNFQSSHGDTIHGFYFLPPDFDASKKYPLIVYYYSGCTPTSKMLEFQYPLQVLAGQGYIIYVCNPSGAIGFGQEFAARHVNAWGIRTADDIIEGTKKFLAEHPYADAKHVGCMGASYGGFMTEYLQTRTDIFATAVSHAGISNITSYWGGGNWGYTYGEVAAFGSYPWNNPDLYVKQSSLFNADKIHTPLLLLHGTADTNVPTKESQQLFTALRILGRPVSYVCIDGENHVITNYNKRMAWQNVIFAWFAHWLKEEPLWWKTLYPEDKFGIE